MKTSRAVVMALAVAAAAVAARGKDLEIASAWAGAAVPVDGGPGEWAPLLRPLGDPPLVIGLQNDARYLYLCLRTSDPIVKMQLVRLGLTVWFNGDGKDSKTFGVRFPVAAGPQAARRQPDQGEPPEGGSHAPSFDRAAQEVELIGPTKDDRERLHLAPDDPVQAALGDDSGVLVLEMRVPLQPSEAHPLAVGAAPGAAIALGLATERPKGGGRGRLHLGGGGEPGEGGPGDEGGMGRGRGGYGGRGGMGEGMRGGGMRGGATPAPIDVWLRVTLAKGPVRPPAE
ncbi:MAG: hypothetical protein PHQ91_03695 [Thermoanaerobaculaceae bacterium]|nr:hypothetical protein [Thermoanaerobaculaceae bacterium]